MEGQVSRARDTQGEMSPAGGRWMVKTTPSVLDGKKFQQRSVFRVFVGAQISDPTCRIQVMYIFNVLCVSAYEIMYLENIGKYHFSRQLWLFLGVKLMEISSNLLSRCSKKYIEAIDLFQSIG